MRREAANARRSALTRAMAALGAGPATSAAKTPAEVAVRVVTQGAVVPVGQAARVERRVAAQTAGRW